MTKVTLYQRMCVGGNKKPVNFEAQGAAVTEEKRISTPKNTTSAYEPKGLEFHNFFKSLYGGCSSATLVTPEKVFGFLYYQAHRLKYLKKRKSGFFTVMITTKSLAKLVKTR